MNNINKLLSLNEDFNFNNFSKKVSNKDIVKIIKENNKQNYIIEKFSKYVRPNELFYNMSELDKGYINGSKYPNGIENNIKIISIEQNNYIYYPETFDNLILSPNKEIRINLKNNITDCCNLFHGCTFYYLDLSHFDTSKVTDMSYMFYGCIKLEKLDLSHFDTSKVTDMCCMFNSCSVPKLDLSYFNTSKVTNMALMFFNCQVLREVNLSSFNTSNVTTMRSMFAYCESLKKLDLSHFNTSNVDIFNEMFIYCISLEKLNLSSFDTSKECNISKHRIHMHMLDNSPFNKRVLANWLDTGGISSNLPYPNVKPLQK